MSATLGAFLRTLLVALLMACHSAVFALSVADIQLNSSLNEKLDAVIPLHSISASELENLKVGIIYDDSLSNVYRQPKIKVDVVTRSNGKHYLQLKSIKPVTEPVVNFILELSWSTGRLNRQYQLLIDPEIG